jgi:hypothetical protein
MRNYRVTRISHAQRSRRPILNCDNAATALRWPCDAKVSISCYHNRVLDCNPVLLQPAVGCLLSAFIQFISLTSHKHASSWKNSISCTTLSLDILRTLNITNNIKYICHQTITRHQTTIWKSGIVKSGSEYESIKTKIAAGSDWLRQHFIAALSQENEQCSFLRCSVAGPLHETTKIKWWVSRAFLLGTLLYFLSRQYR